MDLGGTNFRIVRVDMKDGEATTNTTYFDLDKELLSGPCDKVKVNYLLNKRDLKRAIRHFDNESAYFPDSFPKIPICFGYYWCPFEKTFDK